MLYTQKIYINNKPLIVTNSAENYIIKNPVSAGYLFLKGASPQNFRLAQQHLENHLNQGVIIEAISVEALQAICDEIFPPVLAAGGVVTNQDGDILMIFRRGRWDLPKGKLDPGEKLEDCAIREVIEETGLPSVSLGDKICKTNHVYARDGQQYLKVTHWYQMSADKAFRLYPQLEENIIEVKWVSPENLGLYLHLSYEAIKEVLQHSGKTGKLIS
jgi:8-oxo-dGTP pyrophosphatase MutT (NUDIX family)